MMVNTIGSLMSLSPRSSISFVAGIGTFCLLLGVWSFSDNRNGVIQIATGLFLIALAIFRYLKENKKAKKTIEVLNKEEE